MATTYSKVHEKSPVTHSSTANGRHSLLRTSTIAVAPIPTPSPKKLEKDILKHASRIRTRHINDYFARHQNSFKSPTNEYTTSVSNSPTRSNQPKKRTKIIKPSKTISLVSVNNTENKIHEKINLIS
jgi:hypothetical protein